MAPVDWEAGAGNLDPNVYLLEPFKFGRVDLWHENDEVLFVVASEQFLDFVEDTCAALTAQGS